MFLIPYENAELSKAGNNITNMFHMNANGATKHADEVLHAVKSFCFLYLQKQEKSIQRLLLTTIMYFANLLKRL